MSIFIKRNDVGDVIPFTCEHEDGSVVDLTGATVKFNMGKKNKLISTGTATITDAPNGKVQYILTNTDTLLSGNYPAEFEVTFSNGNVKTFPTIGYLMVNIEANLDLGKSSQVTDQIVLKQSDIEQFKNDINTKVANLDATNTRIDNILNGAGGSTAEVVDARASTPQGNRVYITLRARLDDMETTVATHLADSVYQTAGGTATAITLTISGTLSNGYPMTFIASANNGGAATTINGKPLYKPNTTTAPNLIAGKAYTVWYNSTSACFFIKASAEGNTIAAHVLAGDTFSNDSDTGLLGAMPNNGTFNLGLGATVPAGYYSGGSVPSGKLYASGAVTSSSANSTFTSVNGTSNATPSVTVTGLTFKPTRILLTLNFNGQVYLVIYKDSAYDPYQKTAYVIGDITTTNFGSAVTNYPYKGDVSAAYVNNTGFCLPVLNSAQPFQWEAWG